MTPLVLPKKMKFLLGEAPLAKLGVSALFCVAMVLYLSSCAVAPLSPLSPNNPANPSARERPSAGIANPLAADPATQKTNRLLEAAERGTLVPPAAQPDQMPGMNMGGSHAGH